jgi:hypothetical protein
MHATKNLGLVVPDRQTNKQTIRMLFAYRQTNISSHTLPMAKKKKKERKKERFIGSETFANLRPL